MHWPRCIVALAAHTERTGGARAKCWRGALAGGVTVIAMSPAD